MATCKRRFTAQMVERLNAPKQGRLEYADSARPGLILRVTERGVKSFSVIYKVPGEGGVSAHGRLLVGPQHRITLGRTPPLTLTAAREQADALLRKVTEGHDPRIERREDNRIRHSNTFDAVKGRFIDQYAKLKLRNWKTTLSTFDLHVKPEWGDTPIRDIRRKDVHELLDTLVAKGRVGTAREVRKHLHRLFNWALDREIVTVNPLHNLQREDLAKNEDAGRGLSDEELRVIWKAACGLSYPLGPLNRLWILTGQRRNEWARARRSEVDGRNRWLEVPKARYKGNRDHIVPLEGEAWSILEALPVWQGNDYYLFSRRGGKVPVSDFSGGATTLVDRANAVLRKERDDPEATLAYFRPSHDFRVTCETRLAALGFNQEIRDRVLGHAQVGLQKTYNKHDYLEEKRAALRAYSEHVLAIAA